MAQTKPKAAQFYGVSGDGTAGQVLISDGNGGMFWGDNTENYTVSWATPTGQSLTYTQPSPQSSSGAPGSTFPSTTFTATPPSGKIISGTATIAGLPPGITATQSLSAGANNVLTVTLTGVFPGADSLNTALTISGLTIATPLTVDYLVVAGGGGGGGAKGGNATIYAAGGGGGGYKESQVDISLSTNYDLTVGAGGSGGVGQGNANNGSNSVFSDITATFGYGGGDTGGGNSGDSPSNNGGSNESSPYWGGGGGAGADSVGSNGTTSSGGDGGNGITSTLITTGIATSESVGEVSGSSVYFAGGGGGSAYQGGAGTGGSGGGGNGRGGTNGNGFSGTPNTGGGGGAAGAQGGQGSLEYTGGSGGSGVVILRYPNTHTVTIGSGLTGSTTTDGSDKITIFTAGTGTITFGEA